MTVERHVLVYIRRIGFLLVIYSVLRLVFLVYNWDKFSAAVPMEVLKAVLLGVRFDVSAIFSLAAPFTLLSLLPHPWMSSRPWQEILRTTFWFFNFPLLLLGMVDLEFYRFTDRRTTAEIFNLSNEIRDQLGHLWRDYWGITLLVLGGMATLWFAYPKLNRRDLARVRITWYSPIYLLVAFLSTVLLVRGTLAVRPLASGHAFVFSVPSLGNLALNTPFVFIKSIQNRMEGQETRRIKFFDRDDEAQAILQRSVAPLDVAPMKRHNLFLIVVESLDSERVGFENNYTEDSRTPFLDSLARSGVAFTNHYANSKRSITALPAILLSIPDWLPTAFSTSIYQSNLVYGLGHGLQSAGYKTYFFHGARNGTMTFDYVSRTAGLQHYYALDQYGAYPPEDHDGSWGIYDEPMLKRINEIFDSEREPFAGVFFTLSTHQPQKLPTKYKTQFRGGAQGIGPATEYFDHSLRQFFESASKAPWFKNTLFVITGDHTFQVSDPRYQSPIGNYDVPLLFYHPSRSFPATDPTHIAQQLDITPTIFDLLGIREQPQLPFGRSLFSSAPARALLRLSDQYALVTNSYLTLLSEEGKAGLYRYRSHSMKMDLVDVDQVLQENLRILRAYIQFFRNGLVENSWFRSASSTQAP